MSKCTCVYETRKNSRAVREGYVMSGSIMKECDNCKSRKAAKSQAKSQAQASKPIAAVHGWFHGECVIRALDPEAVLPAGMALYSQPQAQAGEWDEFCDANCTWLDHHKDCKVLPLVWMRTEDVPRTMIATEGERAEVAPDKEDGFDVPLYTRPQPAQVNQQLLDAVTYAVETLEMCGNYVPGGCNRGIVKESAEMLIAAITAAQEGK